MKFLFLYLNFLICFSTLLDEVDKELVDNSLLKLPKRENTDILTMVVEISKAKKDYAMTDAEAAYFAYKWIGQNIEIDCLGNKYGNSSTNYATTYEEGKGGYIGITGLFNALCFWLYIESNTIIGKKKTITYNYTGNLIDLIDYSWNSISIDNKYYLIDVADGLGQCSRDRFYKSQRDDYFGIEPELSIRHRFPNDKKWQLLSEPITEEKFKSQSILNGDFFKCFKSITPDIQTIKNQKNLKIKLNVKDQNIQKVYFWGSYEIQGEAPIIDIDDTEVSVVNGTCEYTVNHFGNGYSSLDIKIKKDGKEESCGWIKYEVIYNK